MASELGWVGLGISPDFTGFKGKVDHETAKVMGAAGVHGGEQFGTAAGKSAGSKFTSAVKSAAKVAAVGLAAGAALAFKFGGDALEEAREAQKVGALTTSTIKATGGAAKVTAQHVADLSGKISEQAGIDDEVIQRGANMLLTFKNVRNEVGKGSKIFDRTTQAITDMAAGMAGGAGGDIDLKSSSILMGKALNDPVKGLSALTRVGVTFTDQQKAINTALVEGGNVAALNALGFKVTTADFTKAMEDRKLSAEETVKFFTGPMSDAEQKYFDHLAEGGHTLEAQKNILKEVNSQFSGAAAAQATDADKMKVAWSNFKEEVGTELLPVMDDLANFLREKGIPKAREFFGWIKDEGVPAVKDLADDLKPVVGHVKDLAGFLNDLPKEVKIGGLAGIAALFGAAKLGGGKGGLLGSAGSVLGLAKPIPVFVTNAGGLGAGGLPGAGGKPGAPIIPGQKPPKIPKGGGLLSLLMGFPLPAAAAIGADQPKSTPVQFSEGDIQQLHRAGFALNEATGEWEKQFNLAFDGIKTSLGSMDRSIDLVGAKKINPSLRIPEIMQERDRLNSFGDKLDLVGAKKIRPGVEITGIDHARAQIDDLVDGLNTLASFDPTGITGLAAVGAAASRGRNGPRPRNDGRDSSRRRNLGGHG